MGPNIIPTKLWGLLHSSPTHCTTRPKSTAYVKGSFLIDEVNRTSCSGYLERLTCGSNDGKGRINYFRACSHYHSLEGDAEMLRRKEVLKIHIEEKRNNLGLERKSNTVTQEEYSLIYILRVCLQIIL